MEIRSAVNLGPRVRLDFEGVVGRTKLSMQKECDINQIMAKYQKTGLIDHFAKHGGDYGFASAVSLHEAMNIVTKAEQMFDDLPSKARSRFEGDPARFLEFVQNPANQQEMFELGLSDKAPEKPVSVIESAAPAVSAEVGTIEAPADSEPSSAL